MKDERRTKTLLHTEIIALQERLAEYEKTACRGTEPDSTQGQCEDRFKELADCLPEVVCESDEQGILTFVNKKAFDAFGYSQSDFNSKLNVLQTIISADRDRAKDNIQKIMTGQNIGSNEYTALRKDGTTFPVIIHSTPIIHGGKSKGLRTIVIDITERKRVEEELRESEARFKQITDTIEDVVWITDWVSHKILYVSPAYEKIWGQSVQNLYENYQDWTNAIHPDDRQHAWDTFLRLAQEDVYDEEYRVVRPDGSVRWIRDRGFPIRAKNGQVYRVAGIAQDITQRKEAEQRQSLAMRILELLNFSGDKIDTIGNILVLIRENTSLEAIGLRLKEDGDYPYYDSVGFPAEFVEAERYLCTRDTNGEHIYDMDGNPVLECMCGNVLCGNTDATLPFFTSDGSFWTNSTTQLLATTTEEERQSCLRDLRHGRGYESVALIPLRSNKEIIGLLQLNDSRKNMFTLEMIHFFEGLGASIGITLARQKAQEILEHRERQQKVVSDLGQQALAGIDLPTLFDQAVTLISQTLKVEYCKVLELQPGRRALVLRSGVGWKEDLVGKAIVGIERNSQAGYTLLSCEPIIVHDLRSEKRFSESSLLHQHGITSGMSVVIGDYNCPYGVLGAYTKRKHSFTQDDSNFLLAVANILASAIERKRVEESLRVERDKLKNILDNMNDAVIIEDENYTILYENKRTTELCGDIVGKKCYETFRSRTQPCTDVFCAVEHYHKQCNNEPIFYNTKTEGGFSWDIFAIPFIDETGKRMILEIAKDVTQQEHIRNQLLQSEKMSALGQLISGVAHELNNPMSSVLGFSQLLLIDPDIPEKTKEILERINSEAERARKIIQNLLTFARKRKPAKKKIALNETLNRTLDLRLYEMNVSNIEVIRHLDSNLPSIHADEHQLQQVFMNLIINAEQAMLGAHEKGRLDVISRLDTEGNGIQIIFKDDGPGISQNHMSKIFDPFFTTKPDGEGTGLGLSISYGIVQEHGGSIHAENLSEGGAIFTIELPVVQAESVEITSASSSTPKIQKIIEKRILAVDDEASVLDVVRIALEGDGHTVETATDGYTALQKIRSTHFDAVISDCKMPGKSGFDIFLYCKTAKPDLAKRFLFLTGDIISPDSLRFMAEHELPYLSKPFDIKELVQSVSRLFEPVEPQIPS